MPEQNLTTLATLIGDDSHACTFQSLGQYRAALLKAIDQASAAPEQQPVAWGFPDPEPAGRPFLLLVHSPDAVARPEELVPLYTRADPSEVERLRAELAESDKCVVRALNERDAALKQLAEAQSAAGSLQDLCRFLAASYCELDELRYTTARLPADQISDFLIGKWPVIQGTANQMNIKRISGQPYDQVGALQGIIAMLATAQASATQTDHSVALNKMVEGQQ